MSQGMFKSLYGKPGQGLYHDLFNDTSGSIPRQTASNHIRLGESDILSVFQGNIAGIPVWLISVAVLGFVLMRKKKLKVKATQ